MSSVVVGWTGRCPDRRDRARLIAHLERLAEVSDSYLRTRLPEPVIAIGRAGALPSKLRRARANIDHVNRTLSGQIVISSGIVPDQNTFSPPQPRLSCRQSTIPSSNAPRSPGSTARG